MNDQLIGTEPPDFDSKWLDEAGNDDTEPESREFTVNIDHRR